MARSAAFKVMSGYTAFPDNIALAEHAAQQWLQLLAARDDSKPFTVALSGGRTPKLLYKAVAKQMAEVSFNNVHFFWGDEKRDLGTITHFSKPHVSNHRSQN